MRFGQHNEYALELAKIDCHFAIQSHNKKSGLWDREMREHRVMANETLKKIVGPGNVGAGCVVIRTAGGAGNI